MGVGGFKTTSMSFPSNFLETSNHPTPTEMISYYYPYARCNSFIEYHHYIKWKTFVGIGSILNTVEDLMATNGGQGVIR